LSEELDLPLIFSKRQVSATQAEKDDAYRAIGRWFVEFSRMFFHMRIAIERRLAKDDDPVIAQVALGYATADQLTTAFFRICEIGTDLDKEEKQICARLRQEVRDETKRRNDFAHGDWWIGFGSKSDGKTGDPYLWRTKPGKKDGPSDNKELPVEELDRLSGQVYELRQMVAEVGDICINPDLTAIIWGKPIRIRDVFRYEMPPGQVVRDGPLAEERRFQYS
jgi:hypothetical protein